jgi:putative transposase
VLNVLNNDSIVPRSEGVFAGGKNWAHDKSAMTPRVIVALKAEPLYTYFRWRLLMADENNTETAVEASATATPVTPPVKKQRAKRRQKAAAEVASTSPSGTVKSPRAYRKKGLETTGEAKPPVVATSVAGKVLKTAGTKAIGGNKGTRPIKAPEATTAAGDEMSDLVQLEHENKTLRKALAEKLRAENADLRKRLG